MQLLMVPLWRLDQKLPKTIGPLPPTVNIGSASAIFLKKYLYPNVTFNGTPVMGISKAAQNNWNHPSKVNIGSARALFLNKYYLNFSQILGFF